MTNSAAIQLSFEASGLDPYELAQIPIFDRATLYTELGLCPLQREAAEAAVRALLAGTYGRRR